MTDITGYVNLALLIALIAYLLSVRTTLRRIADSLDEIAAARVTTGGLGVDTAEGEQQ